MSEHRIESLRRAVAASPEDPMLRLMLAEELHNAGQAAQALDEYDHLLTQGADLTDSLVTIGELAAGEGRLPLLRACLERARQAGIVEGVGKLQRLVEEQLAARGAIRVTADGRSGERRDGPLPSAETLTFDQIGGMIEVKQLIHRMIILPLSRPELYAKYGRKTGGGVLLYGPPGCGKTMMARATAGECGLPFVNVRIEDVMDPYLGVSEQNLHAAFETARAQAPCVLFLDELDALAFARHKHHGSDARRLVDVLLQELDAIGSDNDGVLVLAATNAPWDVDEAMLRPGRFDRVVFVPPPDEPARAEILRVLLAAAPTQDIQPERLAESTALFSGADLRAVTERAIDAVIDEALRTGAEPPLRMAQLEQAIAELRPSTVDWLVRAKAYVEFANQSERYAEVAKYLAAKEVRRRLSR